MNPSPCGSGLVLHQITASGMGSYNRRMMLRRSHQCADQACGIPSCMGKEERGGLFGNTFIINFQNATLRSSSVHINSFKGGRKGDGLDVFSPTISLSLGLPKWGGGGEMDVVLCIGQLHICLLSSSHGSWMRGRGSRPSQDYQQHQPSEEFLSFLCVS